MLHTEVTFVFASTLLHDVVIFFIDSDSDATYVCILSHCRIPVTLDSSAVGHLIHISSFSIQSFHWAPHDFVTMPPIVSFILNALRYTYITSDVHLGFTVDKSLPFKFQWMYKPIESTFSIHVDRHVSHFNWFSVQINKKVFKHCKAVHWLADTCSISSR